MSDLLHILPDFDTGPFSHVLPSIEKSSFLTCDLVALSPTEVAKRAQIPPAEAAKLLGAIADAIQSNNANQEAAKHLCFDEAEPSPVISTLDAELDEHLGGGIRPGYVTEITGESGVGKTQFLLTLLLAAQLAAPHGVSKSALYISTEAALSTARLQQLLRLHPLLSDSALEARPSLDRVFGIQTGDLESQDHIIRYQVPVVIRRKNVGLIIIDSIAANYRAEFERPEPSAATSRPPNLNHGTGQHRALRSMADRKPQLIQLGAFLRNLAHSENIAIVVANQISDRFQPVLSIPPSIPQGSAIPSITPDPLVLDHQQKWFTGWGDLPEYTPGHMNLKTPTLGLIWTNQIAVRIALIKANQSGTESDKRRRWMRLVFSPWSGASNGAGVEYEITLQGVRAAAPIPAMTKMSETT